MKKKRINCEKKSGNKAHIKSHIESVIENAFNKRALAFYAN